MSVRFCHVCKGDTLSGAIMDRSGVVECCSSCGTPYPKSAPSNAVVISAKPLDVFDDDDDLESDAPVAQLTLAGVPAPTTTTTTTTRAKSSPPIESATPSTKSRDALRDIRARRRVIRAEIKNLRGLEAEDRELAAAEHAIESTRRATVTPIRSTK